jgi:hypothetical protein
VSLSIPGTTLIIINSYTKAVEMLDQKGPLYSDRPFAAMLGALVGFDRQVGLTPYNARWKKARKWFSSEIGTTGRTAAFDGHLENQGKVFVDQVRNDPDGLYDHVYK